MQSTTCCLLVYSLLDKQDPAGFTGAARNHSPALSEHKVQCKNVFPRTIVTCYVN